MTLRIPLVPVGGARRAGRASRRSMFGTVQRALSYEVLGVHRLTLERFAWTALAVVLFGLWSGGAYWIAQGGLPRETLVELARGYSWQYGSWLFPTMVAATVADNLPLRGSVRALSLTIALLLGAEFGVVVGRHVECVNGCDGVLAVAHAMHLGDALWYFAYAAAIALVYFSRRADREFAAALHASELARVEGEREQARSVLHTMQARIEPTFLLGSLRDVVQRGGADRLAGARLLDLVIRYLRTALPGSRAADSSLSREMTLLRTYLDICALRSNGALGVTLQNGPLPDGGFPPMVLVPLVASTASPAVASGTVDVDARVIDGRVRVAVTARGGVASHVADEVTVAEVRARLRAFHHDRASFVVDRANNDVVRMIVDIPHEMREQTAERSVTAGVDASAHR